MPENQADKPNAFSMQQAWAYPRSQAVESPETLKVTSCLYSHRHQL